MTNIKINIESLSNYINKLNTLNTTHSSISIVNIVKTSKGSSADQIEILNESYKILHQNISQLLNNTIGFFNNVKNSYQESDKSVFNNISE